MLWLGACPLFVGLWIVVDFLYLFQLVSDVDTVHSTLISGWRYQRRARWRYITNHTYSTSTVRTQCITYSISNQGGRGIQAAFRIHYCVLIQGACCMEVLLLAAA
jgi:hypothetical protein